MLTEQQVKKYHIKKLSQLSLKPIKEIPQLEEKAWQRWFVGMYFTEEQKKHMALTDLAIEGRGCGK